jgi:hypothetical protein
MEREPERPSGDDQPEPTDPLDDDLAESFPASDPPSREAPER